MSFMTNQVILASDVAQDSADNDVATATAAAPGYSGGTDYSGNLILLGFIASYSAALAAIKTITITYTDVQGGSNTITILWDFTNGLVNFSLPAPLQCQNNTAASAALAASGTGGTVGRIDLFYARR